MSEAKWTSMDVSERPFETTSKSVESTKKHQSRRNKIRMTIWWTPENYNWLKNNFNNVSKELNKIIDSLREGKETALMVISPTGEAIGRARSLAWIGRQPPKLQVAGSNPAESVYHTERILKTKLNR